jgi:hypothetical protein
VVDRAAGALLDGTSEPALTARILAAEQRFRDLCAITHFEQAGLVVSRNELLRRRMLLEACEQWARELGEISLQSVLLDHPALARLARETVARTDITLPNLIDRLANQSGVSPLAGEPREDLGQRLHHDLSERASACFFASTVHWCAWRRADAGGQVAARLRIPAVTCNRCLYVGHSCIERTTDQPIYFRVLWRHLTLALNGRSEITLPRSPDAYGAAPN